MFTSDCYHAHAQNKFCLNSYSIGLQLTLVTSLLRCQFVVTCAIVTAAAARPVLVRSGTDLISLLILFFFLLGRSLQKSLRLRRFKSDRDEIWLDCSSSKYASTDGVGFLT